MTELRQDEQSAVTSIVRTFPGAPPDVGVDARALRAWLEARVSELLDRQPALLMSYLYRIDVPEADVQHVLTSAPQDRISARLADLMIARELQKIETRRAYRRQI